MNWDAIGAISELLGAIGVIASLVYLATQIRHSQEQTTQNTRALRGGAFQQLQQSLRDSFSLALTVPGLDRVVRIGMTDLEQLTEEEAFRLNFWLVGVMKVYDNALFQLRYGMLTDERWQDLSKDLREMVQNPGVRQWWTTRPGNLSPEFVALVEEILGEESERAEQTQ